MQSKEQLIAENAKLKQEIMEYRDQDRDIRDEMTKIVFFGVMSYSNTSKTLSWFEIFAMIGMLKQVQEEVKRENEIVESIAREDAENRRLHTSAKEATEALRRSIVKATQ